MKDAEFCRRLRLLRERSALTQADLEKRAELPAMLVSQYETGTRTPGLANIKALIRGLNCTADELLGPLPTARGRTAPEVSRPKGRLERDVRRIGERRRERISAMSDKHKDCIRGFYIRSDSWYGKLLQETEVVDEIMVGMYHPDGGSTGEFGIRWTMLGGQATSRLEVFNDAWDALQSFGDMLEWMASVDDQHISPQAFVEALRGMGIADRTERINPHTSPAEREYASWAPA